jgi:membrane protein YdbS with pleckstrin-like domain
MNCGRLLPSGARFCADCGAPTDSEETRFAPNLVRAPSASKPSSAPPSRLPTTTQFAPQPSLARRENSALHDDAEQIIFTARPTILFVGLGYAFAAVAAILLMALLGFSGWAIPAYVLIPLGFSLLLIPAFYHFRRNTVRYTLTDSKVEIDQGFISRKTRNIPLRNIQDVTVTVSILQRLLGFGDIVIDDASEVGGQTVLDNIPNPRRHADLLLRELRRWR